jgi:ATP-dependent Clp protease protease subunit
MANPQDNDLNIRDHTQMLNDTGMYVFMDEVNQDTIRPIIEWILVENHVVKKKKKELLLMICSEGGDLQTAFALIDVMMASAIPVKTIGLGQIASAGLCIFIAGAKGRRVLTPNTSILSHQYSWGSDGKAHELFAQVKEYELTFQRMLELYRGATGLDDDAIRKYLLPPQDVWLSSAEALNLNICDYVSDLKNNQR